MADMLVEMMDSVMVLSKVIELESMMDSVMVLSKVIELV